MKKTSKYLLLIAVIYLLQIVVSITSFATDELPSSYDLRSKNMITPVKNQDKSNYCWAFAASSSLESSLMMVSSTPYDFSESDLIAESMNYDVDLIDAGGTMDMAIAYYINGKGPVYNPNDTDMDFYVGDIQIIPPRKTFLDNALIKKAIMRRGAVYTSMRYHNKYEDSKHNSYYQNELTHTGGHAVSIVGWDDDYSKDNFIHKTPPGDGAFICKNQYGTDYGDKGYFYVSYYDWYIGKGDNGVFMVSENIPKNSKVYSHTPFGKTSFINYDKDVTFANKFTLAEEDELLSGVGFFTDEENVAYELYLISEDMDQSTLPTTPIKTGVVAYAGHHTVTLPATKIDGNKSFIIAVKLLGNNGLALEEPLANYTSKATAGHDQSFLLKDGILTDLQNISGFSNTNVCLNVLTRPAHVKIDNFELSQIKWTAVEDNIPTFALNVQNNTDNAQTISLGLCLYEKKGEHLQMVRSSFTDQTLDANSLSKLSSSCAIPDDNKNYIIKAFLWSTSTGHKVLLETPFVREINKEDK